MKPAISVRSLTPTLIKVDATNKAEAQTAGWVVSGTEVRVLRVMPKHFRTLPEAMVDLRDANRALRGRALERVDSTALEQAETA